MGREDEVLVMSKVVYNPDRKTLILSSKERYAIKGVHEDAELIEKFIRNEDDVVELTEAWFYLTGGEQPMTDLQRCGKATADLIQMLKESNPTDPSIELNAARILAFETVAEEWFRNREIHRKRGLEVIIARYGESSLDNKESREATLKALKKDVIDIVNVANDRSLKIVDNVAGIDPWHEGEVKIRG